MLLPIPAPSLKNELDYFFCLKISEWVVISKSFKNLKLIKNLLIYRNLSIWYALPDCEKSTILQKIIIEIARTDVYINEKKILKTHLPNPSYTIFLLIGSTLLNLHV